MKTILSFVVVAFFVSNLMGMEDGLYDISDSSHPRLIDDLVGQATICSVVNDNTEYRLYLREHDDFPFPTNKMELVISNRTVPISLFLIATNAIEAAGSIKFTGRAAVVTNLEIVPLIAGHFHTKVMDRYHPGYKMLVQFIPAKEEFSTNEPVMVKLRITNVGKTDFAYIEDDQYLQLELTSKQLKAKMVPEVGYYLSPSPGVIVTLEPGESHELSVDLTKWFNFTTNQLYSFMGNYSIPFSIMGNYSMRFCDPVSKDFRTIWEDFASARFQIRIKK